VSAPVEVGVRLTASVGIDIETIDCDRCGSSHQRGTKFCYNCGSCLTCG